MRYQLHVLVVGIVICFLAEAPLKLPLLLALFLAISLLYFYSPSIRSTSRRKAHVFGPEALYRPYEDNPLPGYPRGPPSDDTDPPPIQRNRKRIHPTYRESAYQPRRTFYEAVSDTLLRMYAGCRPFVSSIWYFEVRIQLQNLVLLHILRSVLLHGQVFQFYRDWIVSIGSLVWSYLVGPSVEVLYVSVFGNATRSE